MGRQAGRRVELAVAWTKLDVGNRKSGRERTQEVAVEIALVVNVKRSTQASSVLKGWTRFAVALTKLEAVNRTQSGTVIRELSRGSLSGGGDDGAAS